MSSGQIIVTGASRGIGASIAVELAQQGYPVVCLSRSGDAPAGIGMRCDVGVAQQIADAVEAVAAHGPIVGLVNNAGIHATEAAETLAPAAFEELMRFNLTSMLVASQQVRPHLVAAGGGRIVNMGSLFADFGVAGNLAYCVSKAGAAALTRCLAVEWAKDGIQVFNVAPGYIETDLNREFLAQEKVRRALSKRIPAGRIGASDDVAGLVGMLFDERCRFITGETIRVDGGQGIRL